MILMLLLVYDEKVPRHFWRVAIVTWLLSSKDSEKSGEILRIEKKNTILKLPGNNFVTVENTYHDTNQTDKAREQKLRQDTAIIGELKRKYEC